MRAPSVRLQEVLAQPFAIDHFQDTLFVVESFEQLFEAVVDATSILGLDGRREIAFAGATYELLVSRSPLHASSPPRLAAPVDGASIAAFRVAFLWDHRRAKSSGTTSSTTGSGQYWIDPTFHFTYFGFGWVRSRGPARGCTSTSALIGTTRVRGRCRRLVSASGDSRLARAAPDRFLLDEARYLNHFYAASLFALLLVVVPADAEWSLRSVLSRQVNERRRSDGRTEIRSDDGPSGSCASRLPRCTSMEASPS